MDREKAECRYVRSVSTTDEDIAANVDRIVERALEAGVVATHDDEYTEEIERRRELGVEVCEYPVTMEAAKAGHDLG